MRIMFEKYIAIVIAIAMSFFAVNVSGNLSDQNGIQNKINVAEESVTPMAKKSFTVDDYFNMFPKEMRDVFYAEGWSYEKVFSDLGRKIYDKPIKVLGVTIFDEKKIYIDCRESANASILHEVGHAFECSSYVKGVYSDEFQALYNKNWKTWYANYGMHINNYNTPIEGYAQCYEIYILKPDCLDEDTRNFIANEINSIHLQE